MLTWDTAAWVVGAVFVAIATAIAVIELLRARGSNDDGNDDGDDDPGWGRRGPEQPRGDPGPSGTDPTWWPEFERQFAAYMEDAARLTVDRMHL